MLSVVVVARTLLPVSSSKFTVTFDRPVSPGSYCPFVLASYQTRLPKLTLVTKPKSTVRLSLASGGVAGRPSCVSAGAVGSPATVRVTILLRMPLAAGSRSSNPLSFSSPSLSGSASAAALVSELLAYPSNAPVAWKLAASIWTI